MTEYNGGFKSYTTKALARGPFFKAKTYDSTTLTIASGQVLKAKSFLQTNSVGKAIAHQGIVEKALVTFADILTTETLILGGLTFTSDGGTTKETLTLAWAGLTAGMTAAQANAANVTGVLTGGTFTSGTLTGWNTIKSSTADSVLFVSTTPIDDVSDLADTGTATNPDISTTGVDTIVKIAGVLMYDVDASSGDVDASVFKGASFYEDALVWEADPATDTVEKADGTTVACTDYYIGATTDALKRKFVEGSNFQELGFQYAGEVY